jgi:haloalkane dehalogenase
MAATENRAWPALEGYPFQGRRLTRPDGLNLHYLDEGAGPPVIMVHGNPSWSFLYRGLAAALAPDHRCLVPDHMGMGFSSRPDAARYGFRLADRVADLAALAGHWNLDRPAHLIVHDWGGPIGLGWAVANPEKVASVLVLNSATRVPPGYRLPFRLAVHKFFPWLGDFLARRHNWFATGAAAFGTVRKMSPAVRRGFLTPYLTPEDRLAVARFVEDIPLAPGHPSYALLTDIDRRLEGLLAGRPLGLVWGLRDFVFNRKVLADWRRRFPKAPVLALPRAGHYLLEDEPGRIAAWARRFLTDGQVS